MSDLPLSDADEQAGEVVLPAPPDEARDALDRALAGSGRREAVAAVVADWPTYLDAWARLADRGRDAVERYAYARIGYHRGLDQLRKHGWRGTGRVRWKHETNRGFLRALDGLRRYADEIGESDEAQRCAEFLRELDPDLDQADIADE